MKVLVIGSGGREHAICWKINQNPDVDQIYCIPGNGGIEDIAECPQDVPVNDFDMLAAFVREKQIDFTVVGPEQPLVDGIVDYFENIGLPVFGPNRTAAQIEGSKIFSKQLMAKYNIPTAEFREFYDADAALQYLNSLSERPIVVKADGLAAGKGAIVCPGLDTARAAVDDMMNKAIFSAAGSKIIIEEFMTGEECSIFVITDGKDYLTLSPAQDFKRALDGDKGKNTGGMGSYAPTPFLTADLYEKAVSRIIVPTLSAFQSEGIEYTGVLYCGLMLTPQGPKVVEFNCRFGDPETQVVLPLLKSDLLEIMQAVHARKLGKIRAELHQQHAAGVVLASGGYPDAYAKGKVISGLDSVPGDMLVFHAGTKREDGDIVTSGGRVLVVAGLAASLKEAVDKAYQGVSHIDFQNQHFRKDIAERAIRTA